MQSPPLFQSTHPCGVRHFLTHATAPLLMFQSTHPCGVRPDQTWHDLLALSFNPRTRVGCDLTHRLIMFGVTGFNPRTRVGCDLTHKLNINPLRVSIHAPVWGATSWPVSVTVTAMFQSTHPCGVRHWLHRHNKPKTCFNPRTRVGCDGRYIPIVPVYGVSIHAPVWGAT